MLEDHGREDWILANLICQAIWNYCIESTNLHAALGPEVINRFIAILVDYIGNGLLITFLYTLNIIKFCNIIKQKSLYI